MTSSIQPKSNTTIAYTDGACKGNPGAGGWGAYLIFSDGTNHSLYAGEDNTTNNRMEMMATIEAITYACKHKPDDRVELWTDSGYVKNGITQWIDGWKQKGWKTASKKPVKNQDLWQQLDNLNQSHNIDWNWIKGHAGHPGNERADELANLGVVNPHGNLNEKTSNNLKKNLTNTSQSNNDWMTHDILGFDEYEDYPEDEFEEEINSQPLQSLEPSPLPHKSDNSPIDDKNVNSTIMTDNRQRPQTFEQPVHNIQPLNQDLNQNMNQPINQPMSTQEPVEKLPEFDGDTSKANPYFRALLPHPINQGRNHRQLIMDTETTGFEYNNGDRIIEVGIVEMVGRKFTGEKLHVYINPNRKEPMSEEVIRVHGITDAFLEDKPTFDKVARQVYDFMVGAEIIAHNANFDMNFLDMEFNKVGLPRLSDNAKVTDSLAIAKNQYPGQRNTLDALVKRLNVGKQDRTFHGALLDSEILAEVFLAMTGGQVSLAIDEDNGTRGEVQHATFAELSSLLVSAPTDETLHEQWIANISSKFPNVQTVWHPSPVTEENEG